MVRHQREACRLGCRRSASRGLLIALASVPRRHLTILFADLSQFTALSGSVEPERCLAVVQHLKRCSRQVITRHGGIVVDFRGDSVMAMFGFPEPSEQDGRRASEAALELHVAIGQLPENCVDFPPLRLHTGVHCGPVLLIEDDPAPGQSVVIGEATSVAARLSDLAVDDEILVSGTTLGGDSHFFQVRDRGPLRLQGKMDPVPVMQVLGHWGCASAWSRTPCGCWSSRSKRSGSSCERRHGSRRATSVSSSL